MRLDLAHVHWQEPHAGRAIHGRDIDILMMLYIGWHLGSPSQTTTEPRAEGTAERPDTVINSFEQSWNNGRLSFAVTFLLRPCTVTGGLNAYFTARTADPTLNSNNKGATPMTHAIRFHKTGGPEVLVWEEVSVGKPGPGEARIRHTAVGLNFVDIYNRSGLYPAQLPSGLGSEAAGVVEEVGSGVTDLKPGDRVAYGASPLGAYSEARLIPADRLLKLPDGVDDKTAAAMMLKGLTTQYLIRQTYRVKAGDTILLHAAAGGVGTILSQWAKHLGATVIGTVSNEEKAKLAKAHGCDHVIIYTREDFVKRVDEITGGKKVPVVYDSVGKDTFLKSLDCLAPLGVAALFGQSSGAVEPLNLGLLAQKGSLYVTRPTLFTYAAKRENLVAMANELFDVVKSGAVKIEVHQTYPLKDAAKAHADLAARKTTGSTVLLV